MVNDFKCWTSFFWRSLMLKDHTETRRCLDLESHLQISGIAGGSHTLENLERLGQNYSGLAWRVRSVKTWTEYSIGETLGMHQLFFLRKMLLCMTWFLSWRCQFVAVLSHLYGSFKSLVMLKLSEIVTSDFCNLRQVDNLYISGGFKRLVNVNRI